MYPWEKKYNKYGNQKVKIDGISFDSKHESEVYCDLKWLEKLGKIKNLELQKKFELIPSIYGVVNGKKTCLERSLCYYADFYYFDVDKNEYVVVDAKGALTDVYKIKKKLMLYVHKIRIQEM